MFERLDKLRADVEHCRKRVEQSRMKLKEAEDKLKEAEKMQILSDVKSMNLSPEQLNALLALVSKKNADLVCLENGLSVIKPAKPGERQKRTTYAETKSFRCKVCGGGNALDST